MSQDPIQFNEYETSLITLGGISAEIAKRRAELDELEERQDLQVRRVMDLRPKQENPNG